MPMTPQWPQHRPNRRALPRRVSLFAWAPSLAPLNHQDHPSTILFTSRLATLWSQGQALLFFAFPWMDGWRDALSVRQPSIMPWIQLHELQSRGPGMPPLYHYPASPVCPQQSIMLLSRPDSTESFQMPIVRAQLLLQKFRPCGGDRQFTKYFAASRSIGSGIGIALASFLLVVIL